MWASCGPLLFYHRENDRQPRICQLCELEGVPYGCSSRDLSVPHLQMLGVSEDSLTRGYEQPAQTVNR